MASAAVKCTNSMFRAVSSCFAFYSPVAMLTIVQEVFLQTDSVSGKSGEWMDKWKFPILLNSQISAKFLIESCFLQNISSIVTFVSVSVEAIKAAYSGALRTLSYTGSRAAG